MKKRHFVYIALLLAVFFSVYEVYQFYKPKTNHSITTNNITYNFDKVYSLHEYEVYLSKAEEDFNVIFYTDDDISSQYLFNTILPTIISNNGIHEFNNLIYVKTDSVENINPNTYSTKYRFSSVPCLMHIVINNDGTYKIEKVLQFSTSTPLNYDNVNDFLKTYNIY